MVVTKFGKSQIPRSPRAFALGKGPTLLQNIVLTTILRNKLQNCPKVQTGEFDLDSLCSELQKKAKCSGQGPVIPDEDLHSVINKWSGKAGGDYASNVTKAQAVEQ